MKKSQSQLPISRKAYKGFIERINSAIGEADRAILLVNALDSYLRGEDDYVCGLDDGLRLAFIFLRQDIDMAMARSAKARERAARRKAIAESNSETESAQTELPVHDVKVYYDETRQEQIKPERFVPPLSRRERRALDRKRKKRLW